MSDEQCCGTSRRETLIDRLRGVYRMKVNDGAGPLNGSNDFVRKFYTTPIQIEAANEIESLRSQLEAERIRGDYFKEELYQSKARLIPTDEGSAIDGPWISTIYGEEARHDDIKVADEWMRSVFEGKHKQTVADADVQDGGKP